MNGTSSNPLPRRKRIRLPLQDYFTPTARYFVIICCRGKKPLLTLPSHRSLLRDLLCRTARAQRVELAAYTVLPTHLHFIASGGRLDLLAFVREFKSRSAVELGRRGLPFPQWQRSFFDRKLRSKASLRKKCAYIWHNPVRAGLAKNPEGYPWSGSLLTG